MDGLTRSLTALKRDLRVTLALAFASCLLSAFTLGVIVGAGF